jgi:hypothetical protein
MKIRTRKPVKRLNGLDKYVIYCIVFFTCYTIAELTVSAITGNSSDTLTNAVKWFCGGEVFLCAMIKRHKLIDARNAAKTQQEEGGYYGD